MISRPFEMFPLEAIDRGRIEQTDPGHTLWRQALLERIPQGPAEPLPDGDPEPLFPARENHVGEQSPERVLQDGLGLPPGQLERGWNTTGQLNERPVEEGRPDFKAA